MAMKLIRECMPGILNIGIWWREYVDEIIASAGGSWEGMWVDSRDSGKVSGYVLQRLGYFLISEENLDRKEEWWMMPLVSGAFRVFGMSIRFSW